MENNEIVRKNYDADPAREWGRLAQHPFEYEINMRFLRRYVKPGDRVLDVGGGPGRYSIALAELGCEVTLLDLSPENVRLAKEKAAAQGVALRAMTADARDLSLLGSETFDHVLCMGPLYHLLNEADRAQAVRECLAHLRPGGIFAAAWIALVSGVIFMGRSAPEIITNPSEAAPLAAFRQDGSWGGQAFTQAYFTAPSEVLPFLAQFPLQKLHFLGSEAIVCAFEDRILGQSQEVIDAWLDLAESVCEQERFLNFTEHLLYIGRKESSL